MLRLMVSTVLLIVLDCVLKNLAIVQKQIIFKPAAENGRAGRTWHDYLPIHSLTTNDVFQTIKNAGQSPHWAYQDNDRLSCITCIMASASDLIHGATKILNSMR